MSKAGAVGRGLYAVLAFVVNALLRIGVNISLVAAVAVTVYAAVSFSREALKERKEGMRYDMFVKSPVYTYSVASTGRSYWADHDFSYYHSL
ncbi:unnamed protein product [Nippostrongylus brasiliensis]|uniref:Polysaccharide biosynthesis protein n=1 Tax=Nippostrongylus brasiliensis TaxID=27835 RepID=A0A0N4XMX8_NIPBR|nr:unnamed protein product [Nippostrongylus brasiliensis]